MSHSGLWLRCLPLFAATSLTLSAHASGPVVAVYPDPPAIPPLERDKPVWRVSLDTHYQGNATVPDTNGGKLSSVSVTSKVEYFLRTREQFVDASFSYRWRSMNWNNTPNYITDTGKYVVNILAFQKLGNDEWSFVGLVNTTMEAEYNGGDIPSSDSYLFGAGLQYDLSPRLKVGLGASVSYSPMDQVKVWPMLLLHWKINQQLSLSSSNGLRLVYEPDQDKRLRMDLAVQYDRNYMGLHNQPTSPGMESRPLAQETNLDLVAGIEHQINSWLRLRASVDGRVYSEYEFYQGKNRYRTIRPEPSIGFTIRASASF